GFDPYELEIFFGNGDGTFQSPRIVQGISPTSFVIADVNGDGVPDIVGSNCFSVDPCYPNYDLVVLLGDGKGSFPTQFTYTTASGVAAVADINGDGKPDILSDAGVMLGNGDGTFQPPIGPGFSMPVAIADFNGDGHLDVATNTELLLGNGDGTFQPGIYLGNLSGGLAVGDFNGDGRPDLAVGGVTVLLNISRYPTTSVVASSAN